MTEPHVVLTKPLFRDRLIPELCSAVAHVVANFDVTRRFRSGVIHVLHKSITQKAVFKNVDRASQVHVEDAQTLRFIALALRDACPGLSISRVTPAFVCRHFTRCLLAVRRCVALHVQQVPGLRALTALYVDVDDFLSTTFATAAAQLAVLGSGDDLPRDDTSSLPVIQMRSAMLSPWKFALFSRTTLDLLRPHCNLTPFVDMLHALHVAFSRGASFESVLLRLQVDAPFVNALLACLLVRRRLRKTKLREVLQSTGAYNKVAVQLALRAMQRAARYSLTRLPAGVEPRPAASHCDHATFLSCAVCCTCRSAVGGNGARGAARCLYDFDTGHVTCGRKGNLSSLCSATPLLQIRLQRAVVHVEGQGFFARCSLCACFYRYTTASWRKGALTCESCKYVIVDDEPLSERCVACARAYTTPVTLTPHATSDVYLRSRACCTCAPMPAPASAASASVAAPATTTSGGCRRCT